MHRPHAALFIGSWQMGQSEADMILYVRLRRGALTEAEREGDSLEKLLEAAEFARFVRQRSRL